MLRTLAWLMLWCVGAICFAGLTLRYWVGDALALTRYTSYVLPWLILLLAPGAGIAARARRSWLALILSASAAIVVAEHAPVFRYRPPVAIPNTAVPLRVLSFNVWSKNRSDMRIAEVVRAIKPDVILLQEVDAAVFARVLERLRAVQPLHATYDPELMQAVVSRFRVEPRESMRYKGQAQNVLVHAPAGPISVYNVHPLRSGGWQRRYSQVAALLEQDILLETGPVLVGGDFNVTPYSQMYLLLARYLRNAHDEAGTGLGFTFPSGSRRFAGIPIVPVARIDHVFVSGHFVALQAGTVADSGGSDHRPVFAELAQRPSGRR